EASAFFDQCLAVDTDHPEARLGKAIVSFKKGRLEAAHAIFFGLTEDRPDDGHAYWWLGRIAQKRGDTGLAIRCYKDAVMRGGEGPLVHLILAHLYARRLLFFRAFEELKRSFHVWRALY
ncbi:MAG: tetratricopeptide repeat protein, partial [Candidatus Omnitrophota bacterium]